MPEDKIVNLGGTIEGFPRTPIVGGQGPSTGAPISSSAINDLLSNAYAQASAKGQPANDIPFSSFYTGSRYDASRPFTDFEEMAAQQQGTWTKWKNGIVKMVGNAATSFVSGTAGLVYGIGSALVNQRFSDVFNNDVTRAMDRTNTDFEDKYPNYYTHEEQDAGILSTKNILTANFWSDKVFKNLGYSFGSIGGGVAWGTLFRQIGLTNALVKAGRGMETATAVENAMMAVPRTQRFLAFENALSSLSQKYIKQPLSKVLTNSDRVLTSLMGTFGESSMESLQNMNQYRDKLIEEYKSQYGIEPAGEDLQKINDYAEKVGLSTWAMNTMLLTATNYIQLPKILNSSRKVEKAVLNDMKQASVGKAWAEAVPKTTMQKLLRTPFRALNLAFSPSEAFEEGAQYAIQTGTNQFFDRAYRNQEALGGFFSTIGDVMGNVMGEGIEKTLTDKEGLESLLIGGISGGIQQLRGEIKESGLSGYGGERRVNTGVALAALNKTNIEEVLKTNAKFAAIAIGSQDLRQKAIEVDDVLAEKDFEKDYALSYVMPRVRYGKVDSIYNELSYYESQAMTENGFNELRASGIVNEKEDRPQFLARLKALRETAESVDKLYSTINDKYANIYDETGKPLYSKDVIDKLVYAASKVRDYDSRLPELTAKLASTGIDTSAVIDEVFNTGKISEKTVDESFAKIAAMGSVNEDELKTDFTYLARMARHRKQFFDEYNDIKNNPVKYKEAAPSKLLTDDRGEQLPSIKVKTRDGDRDFIVNEEYFAGSPIRKTEQGVDFQEFTKFTFLGKNEDGTIKVRAATGAILNIPEKSFEKYSVGTVRAVEKLPNAKFFIEASGKIFTYQLGGGKKPIQGTIQYDVKRDKLKFVTLDGKKTYVVDRSRFVAKPGYVRAQIYSSDVLTKIAQDALSVAVTPEELAEIYNQTDGVLDELVKSNRAKLDQVNKDLQLSKKELSSVEEALANLTTTRKGLPRKRLDKAVRKTVEQLSKTKERLERTIQTLEAEKSDLEETLFYFEDISQFRSELPEEYSEVVKDLKEEVSALEDMIDNTNDAIKTSKSMLSQVEESLKNAFSLLNDFIKRLKEENPDTPVTIEALRERLERYLGERGAEQFIAEKLGFTQDVIDLEDQISEFSSELEIPDMTNQAERLRKEIAGLESQLDELIDRQALKAKLMTVIEEAAKRYQLRLEEERAVSRDEAIINQMLGTLNQGVQNREYERVYEPGARMSAVAAATSTSAPSEQSFATTGETPAPHHARANRFGARMPNLRNAGEIRGVIVTSETESEIIPGLTNHLKQGKEEIDATTTIALVMAIPSKDGKSYTLVDENGAPIAEKAANESDEDYQNRVLNSAIYQTFPINIENRFRETVPQEVRMKLIAEYEKWRAEKLAGKTLKNYRITPSFGFTEKVQKPKANGQEGTENDYDARVAVQDSGLIKETELGSRQLVYVPTTEETISLGSTSFTNAKGRTFLITKNGYVPLNNRQHTAQEAEAIHQVMVRLAEIIAEENAKGKFVYSNSLEAQRLINWLRTVTYWGTPKVVAGYNSVWFQKTDGGLKLFMSGNVDSKGNSIPVCDFGSVALSENKSLIVSALQRMYLNTNAKATGKDNYNERYEQITGINEDGSVAFVMWPNYQTYLLSKKNPDGTTRKDIPLATAIRPLRDAEDVNRYGIYFTIDEKDIDKRFTDVAPEGKTVTIKPGGTTAPKGKFTLDGTTENSIQMDGGVLRFTVDQADLDGSVKITPNTDQSLIDAMAKKVEAAGGVADVEVIINTLAKYALKMVREDLAAATQQQAAPAPAPVAPLVGKFTLDGTTENTIALKDGSFVFVADEKDLEGTARVVSIDEGLKDTMVQTQIATGNPADEAVIFNTLARFAVVEAKKDIASRTPAPAPTAAPVSDATKRADIEKDEQGNFVPKKYTLNARGENPAPNISLSAIKDESFGGEKPTNVKQVKLLEIRGRNSEGVTVGKVWIQLETGEIYDVEVFFNDAELAALGAPVSNKKAEAESKALAILNRYAEPSSKEVEYQGDEMEGPTEEDSQIGDTSTLGKIIAAFKSFPPVPYNLTSNSIEEFKQKVRDELLEFGLEDMTNDIISNIDKLVNEQLAALEGAKPTGAAPVVTQPVEYDLQGNRNTYVIDLPGFGKFEIVFTANGAELLKNNPKGLSILREGDVNAAVQAVKTKYNLTEDKAKETIRGNVMKSLVPSLTKLKSEQAQSGMELVVGDVQDDVEDDDTLTEAQARLFSKQSTSTRNRSALRVRLLQEIEKFEGEDWNKVEAWLKANFPNVPVYRVKNVLQNTNGVQAWGMFQDGAIYVYENAEVGTVYHEVFEAVWKMFTDDAEQSAVLNEFRNRKGSFEERATGEIIKYSDATRQQAKEQLAEEFRDYVKDGKIPPKPADGRPFIVKLFADLVNFIKTFFTGKSAKNNTEKLFEKIGTGYYKKYSPHHAKLAYGKVGLQDIEDVVVSNDAEFRLKGIRGENIGDIIQSMTYLTIRKLIETNQSLFSIPNLNKDELYAELKNTVQEGIAQLAGVAQESFEKKQITEQQAKRKIREALSLWKNVDSQWDEIVKMHEEKLRSYNIEFDENDNIQLRDQDGSKKSDWQDASKIDNFRKANSAVKLLLSTVPYSRRLSDGTVETIPSSINGEKLLPPTEVYMAVMNRVHNAKNIDEMVETIRQMAIEDPNYQVLYTRLTNNYNVNTRANLTTTLSTMDDVRLLTSFWRTFKKQSPDVKNVYILDNGDVVVGDSNFTTATNQLRDEYINSIRDVFKGKNSYFQYDVAKKKYSPKPEVLLGYSGTMDKRIAFLKTLGIEFNAKDITLRLKPKDQKKFGEAVDGIAESIVKAGEISIINAQTLKISGRLRELAELQAMLDNPEFNSTYFNVNGERVQTFFGTNAASDLYDALTDINNLSELIGTQYEYIVTDVFTKHSHILGRMFDLESGDRIEDAEKFFKVAYADGLVNEETGKKKESSRQSYRDRLIQEINMNLKGYYSNLVPGDASLEWMMYMGNAISEKSIVSGLKDTFDIFKGYLIDEINLAKDGRYVVEGRNAKDLRFMKSILGEDLQNKILKDTRSADKVVNDPSIEKAVNSAIEKFINKETAKFRELLDTYAIVQRSIDDQGNLLDTYEVENLALSKTSGLTNEEINLELKRLSINYMINNIELHKLLYSDPYQYSDELKRIKNFLSPRQAIMYGSSDFNSVMNGAYNAGFDEGDIGYTNFDKDYFRTAVLADVKGLSSLPGYGTYDETDGAGAIRFGSYRNFRIRSGDWNDKEEAQYRYDIVYEKKIKNESIKDEDKKLPISKEEEKIWKEGNPGVMSAYKDLKPITSGNKADGEKYNDIILDKFALYPLSFRILHEMNPESNAIKLYDKMQRENLDYVVYKSARKVGARVTNEVYDENGDFIETVYQGVTNVPFAIMSVQAEVPSKEDNLVTRGSQVTKLITMDYMEAGVPVDFMEDEKNFNKRMEAWYALKGDDAKKKESPLYAEIRNNQDLLQEMIKVGYQRLLEQFSIEETIVNGKKAFKIKDFAKVAKTLREEILKREVNDNISDALAGFENGDVVLEATPAYQQVRNILYSIADREVISPKISGGQKVQLPVSLLESVRAKRTEINGKQGYTSDYLKFYEDAPGKRVCEIMVARWFESDKTDEELLDYFNNTEEGQKQLAALSGVAFRIPTQKQNSIDSFVIKRFLPKEFGDSVIIPSELVKKAGSDFDIDKLFIYLKNVYIDGRGNVKLVPNFGIGEKAKEKFAEMFDKGEFLTESQMQELDRIVEEENSKLGDDASSRLMQSILGTAFDEAVTKEYVASIVKNKPEFRKMFIDGLYKKSLENQYIESGQNLVSNPRNFGRLTTPNSAQQMKDLSDKILKKLGVEKFNYREVGNMLSRGFMTRLRHAFVAGKYAIGIAAVNQTNHSLSQRYPIFINPNAEISNKDRKWLKDSSIRFKNYNSIDIGEKTFATLSMIKNAERSDKFPEGQDISDIIGQFIDGYVDISKDPWIMELGATPTVAGTWLFLVKVGVPIETVAYFMNQPIVRDFLREVENTGSTWLYNTDLVEVMKKSSKYAATEGQLTKVKTIPGNTALFEMIGSEKLTPEQKAQQQFILDEFLKYSKMAEHLLRVTQGTNFDTAAFNDPFLVYKKMRQLELAQRTVISSANDILANSFVGPLAETINDIRNAFSTILRSDYGRMRQTVETILDKYVSLPDRDFIKISQKVVADIFDWAVQVDRKFNKLIEETLLSDTKSAAKEIATFVNGVRKSPGHSLYNNQVIKLFNPKFSEKRNGVNNIQIKNKDNKVYDQNQLIYAFNELKEHLKGIGKPELYNKLVKAAVLQSGLSNSSISFTSLLPYEDFKDVYNQTLAKLEKNGSFTFDNFLKLNVFERNNWNNDDVVPHRKAQWRKDSSGRNRYNTNMYFGRNKELQAAINAGKVPKLLKLSTLARDADFDVIVYSWQEGTKKQKEAMRRAGDYSYIKKGLFVKVKDQYGDPITEDYVIDGQLRQSFVYKAVNAWGDASRANEFYDVGRKSVIDNGFIQVNEVEDIEITQYFAKEIGKDKTDQAPRKPGKIKPAGLPGINDNNQNSCG